MSARKADTIIFSPLLPFSPSTAPREDISVSDLDPEIEALLAAAEDPTETDVQCMARIVEAMRYVLRDTELSQEVREATVGRLRDIADCGTIGGRMLQMFAMTPAERPQVWGVEYDV